MPEMLKGADRPDFLEQFGTVLQQTMNLSPDEHAARMEQARKLWRNGDVADNVDNRKNQLLKVLESIETLPKEELERFNADPAYYESRIRHVFDRMGKHFFQSRECSRRSSSASCCGDHHQRVREHRREIQAAMFAQLAGQRQDCKSKIPFSDLQDCRVPRGFECQLERAAAGTALFSRTTRLPVALAC
jgi:hypothetical protein